MAGTYARRRASRFGPAMTNDRIFCDRIVSQAYAGTLSGNTASILVFSVAALNGLTM
jgi:hypothetical protein